MKSSTEEAKGTPWTDGLSGMNIKRQVLLKVLAKSDSHYRTLFVDNPSAMLLIDPKDGEIVDANPAICAFYGESRENLTGKRISALDGLPPEEAAAELSRLRKGQRCLFSRHRLACGDVRDVEITCGPITLAGWPLLYATVQDVTERRHLELALQESEGRFRSIFTSAGAGMAIVSPQGRFLEANPAFCNFTGYTVEELRGLSVEDLTHPADRERTRDLYRQVKRGQVKTFRWEKRYLHKNGSTLWVLVSAAWVFDRHGHPAYAVGLAQDLTEHKCIQAQVLEKEERLRHLTSHDALTGLPNRMLCQDRLEHAMARSRRSGVQVAILELDLDRFKDINDSLGHELVDRLLQEVGGRIGSCVREADTLARLGGDEFAVILEQVDDLFQIPRVVQQIMQRLETPIAVAGHSLYVTASIGISVFPGDAADAAGLMKCANMAMYRAKAEGRNTFQFYTPDMNARAGEFLLLETRLHQALEQGQLLLHYQPQVELSTGRVIGMEALVRWQHPEMGLIPPGDFIPRAEVTGLIVPIGEWVLRTACAQAKAWLENGHAPLRMAVNISARQFRRRDFVAMVEQVLEETGFDPNWLELEITESVIMEDIEKATSILSALKQKGIHLAIDDFGTGYSSLGRLKHFPLSKLKIDRSFVCNVPSDAQDVALAATIIALGHSMQLEVIAEGVETAEQLEFLCDKNCQYGQGYFFSRPLPAGELQAFL